MIHRLSLLAAHRDFPRSKTQYLRVEQTLSIRQYVLANKTLSLFELLEGEQISVPRELMSAARGYASAKYLFEDVSQALVKC